MKVLARKLRRNSTDAERTLWKCLHAHRMAGYKFRRQYVIEPYIVDFICLEKRLIVEADGGQHLEQESDDRAGVEYLESLDNRVLCFWNHDILRDTQAVLETIRSQLQ